MLEEIDNNNKVSKYKDMKKKLTLKQQLAKGGFVLIPNKTFYYVNKKGEIASTRHGKLRILKQNSNNATHPEKGYLFVKMNSKKPIYVHRIVWETFVGPIPKGYDIHHIGNKHDNSLNNLECVQMSKHRSQANKGRVFSKQSLLKMSLAKKGRTRKKDPVTGKYVWSKI